MLLDMLAFFFTLGILGAQPNKPLSSSNKSATLTFFLRAVTLFFIEIDAFVPVLKRSLPLDSIGKVDLLSGFFVFVLTDGTLFGIVLGFSVVRVSVVALAGSGTFSVVVCLVDT